VAGLDALVMVVDGDGEGSLGGFLANDVLLQGIEDLPRLGQLKGAEVRYLGQLLFNDFVAQVNALITDVDAGAGNELADLLLAFSTERALEQIGALTNASHNSVPLDGPSFQQRRHPSRAGQTDAIQPCSTLGQLAGRFSNRKARGAIFRSTGLPTAVTSG
jgi:hypothetical protein